MEQKRYFTSDNHFFHKGILNFCSDTRQGRDFEEMNELMIKKWNETVMPHDIVYTLGDFSFGRSDKTELILQRLHGQIHLIKGNHDQWLNESCAKYFESISDYKKIEIEGDRIIMFHYPIFEWQDMHRGSYHLFGHVHGNLGRAGNHKDVPGRAMDVGIDARPQRDMGLWEWSEIKAILEKKEIRTHHGKNAL